MADQPISGLGAVGTLVDADLVAVSQSGVAKKAALSALSAYVAATVLDGAADVIEIEDTEALYTGETVEEALAEVKEIADGAAQLGDGVDLAPSGGAAPYTFLNLPGTVLTNGVPLGQADGTTVWASMPDLAALLYDWLFPAGVSAIITAEQGSDVWSQGGGTQGPSIIADGAWTLTNPATTGDLLITYTGDLPTAGSSAITKLEYDLDGSGTGVEATGLVITAGVLAVGPPDTHTISGLTDTTEYDVRLRAVSADGNGPWSAVAKSATPTVPPAYTPHFVSGAGTPGQLTHAGGALGADSVFLSFGLVFRRMFNTGGTIRNIFSVANGRIEYTVTPSSGLSILIIKNTAGTTIAQYRRTIPYDADIEMAVTYDGTGTAGQPASFEWWENGVQLAVTGNSTTGLIETTPAVCGTIDHNTATGGSWFAVGAGNVMYVAELFWKKDAAVDPSILWSGTELLNWSTLGFAPQIGIGGGATAAEWNDLASLSAPKNYGTFDPTNAVAFAEI